MTEQELEMWQQDLAMIEMLRKEKEKLEQRIDEAIDYIEKNSGMISKFTKVKATYAQEELSTDQLDNLLEILKGE